MVNKATKITYRAGPIGTALLFILAALFLVASWPPGSWYEPVHHLFSGGVFADNRLITGGALDQPSLQKFFFLFCLNSGSVAFFILAIRFVCDRSQQIVRWIFSICSTILLVTPFSILTLTVIYNLRYISAMGVTPWRIGGLAFGALCYAALGCFLLWVCISNREQENPNKLT